MTKQTADPFWILKGLPPALIITDENDVLRDEDEEYARRLMQAGVDMTVVRYVGTFHDFVTSTGSRILRSRGARFRSRFRTCGKA